MSNELYPMDDFLGKMGESLPKTWVTLYTHILNQVSIALVEYRMKHNLNQAQLAEELDVSQAMISKYESGDYNISMRALIQLLCKLNIPFDFRIGSEAKNTNVRNGFMELKEE